MTGCVGGKSVVDDELLAREVGIKSVLELLSLPNAKTRVSSTRLPKFLAEVHVEHHNSMKIEN